MHFVSVLTSLSQAGVAGAGMAMSVSVPVTLVDASLRGVLS